MTMILVDEVFMKKSARAQAGGFAKRNAQLNKAHLTKYVLTVLVMILLTASVLIPNASALTMQVPTLSDEGIIIVPGSSVDSQPSRHSDTITTTEGFEFVEIMPGEANPIITEVQQRLMLLGYMHDDEPTEYYGSSTEYALQLFQRNHDITIDGQLDSVTFALLFSDNAEPYSISLGYEGNDVAQLQKQLRHLGYMLIRSTGEFGPETDIAVKRFQLTNALLPNGIVDENTWDLLFADEAEEARTSQMEIDASQIPRARSNNTSGNVNSSSNNNSTSGGSSGGSGAEATSAPDSSSADRLIAIAEAQIDKKYARGSKGPDAFDCSGFVYWCLNNAGFSIRYMKSSDWPNSAYPIVSKMSDMKRGDIICFKGHVGIYMGGGKMIDASQSHGKVVIRTNILSSTYWTEKFICAKRVF